MPKTPRVRFSFKNENVQSSVPMLGITHFVARTTKGKFNDPSLLITSYPQFQREFGEEIVPDGSISNIKKALELGSKIRVSRVAGSNATYGYAAESGETSAEVFSMVFTSGVDSSTVTLTFKVHTKEKGSKFDGTYDNLYLKFTLDSDGPNTKIILVQSVTNAFNPEDILDSRVFISWNTANGIVDYQSLQNFVTMVPNVEVEVSDLFDGNHYDIYAVIAWLSLHTEYLPATSFVTNTVYTLPKGTDGGESTSTSWEDAFDALRDYVDAYNLVLSHIHQHLPNAYKTIYQSVAEVVKANQEVKLLVELPKPAPGTAVSAYLAELKTLVNTVGQSEFICYYGGGIKYYDQLGVIRDCDVLGSVVGLADVSASKYGPWRSPAGQNRGILPDALGPVMPNLGSPTRIDDLQGFADWYMNLFVIKDTATAGKRTMLWHNFSSSPVDSSSKFQSTVNINLYLKKNLRPILESYIEEPNTFSTWRTMYDQVKPLLDDLITNQAITEYNWNGDQYAQKYEDLQVNTEEEVRHGKYKVALSYKDIVTLQEVHLELSILKADKSISITINE